MKGRPFLKKVARLSLRQRLIISAILCVLLPSITTLVVSNYFSRDTLEQKAVKQSEDTLRMLNISISNYLDDLMYVSNYIQFNDEINSILINNRNDSETITKNEKALQHVKISRNLEGITDLLVPAYITILMNNGNFYTNYATYEYNPNQFYNEEWIKQIENLNFYQTHWLGTHPTYIQSKKDDDPYLITIARALKTSGVTYAYTIISISEREVSRMFRELSTTSDEELLLVNSIGDILSSKNETQIQTKFNDINQVNSTSSHSIVDYGGKDHLLVEYPLSYADWHLVSLVPYKKTVGNINAITRTTLIIQFVFFSIFLFILIYLVKELTKPLHKLIAVTNEVEKGKIQVRSGISGEGDIAFLGYSFDKMLDKIEDMIQQVKVEETNKHKAELEMLQAQINPHFLFNILNSIRLKIMLNGDKDSANLIQSLSSLLRMTINRNNAFIPLHEEIEIVTNYIKLMNFRHKHHVELISDLASNTLIEEVPRFFLQPLIENAIIHGFDQKGGTILISAWLEGDQLIIVLKDNGKGMHAERLDFLNKQLLISDIHQQSDSKATLTGIGIRNIYHRLRMIYGKSFSMEINSRLLVGTEIKLFIPRT